MTTVASKVQFNISAKDQTASAFASVRQSMTSLARTGNQIKAAFAGLAGGNLLAGFVRSMVNINKASLPVKTSIDNLGAAWTKFGMKVGEGGLNTALISFSDKMNAMLTKTDGLSSSIGKLIGGAVNTMSKVFEGIGRSIAFVYDNFAILNRVAFAFIGIKIAQNIAFAGMNFLRFAAAVRSTGLAMGLFNIMTSLSKKGILGLAAGGLVLAFAFDDVKKIMDAMIAKMEDGLGPAFGMVRKGMEALGFDTKALQMELAGGVIGQGLPGSKLDESTEKIKKLSSGIGGLKDAGASASSVFQDVGQTFSSAFSTGLQGIIDRTTSVKDAFSNMATSILKDLTNLFANSAMQQLFGGGSSGGGILGKLFSGLFQSSPLALPSATFGGPKAGGGPVMAGKSYTVGERGPETLVMGGSGTIITNPGALNLKVNVQNYGSDKVDVKRSNGPGGPSLDVIIGQKIDNHFGSGRANKTMRAQFGLNPQKARR